MIWVSIVIHLNVGESEWWYWFEGGHSDHGLGLSVRELGRGGYAVVTDVIEDEWVIDN
jgi:hypothetical protein